MAGTPSSGSSSSGSRPLSVTNRREKDAVKLMKAGFKVDLIDNSIYKMRVEVVGPQRWRVIIELPEGYPRIPAVVHFEDSIYHANIDQVSGFVCATFLDETEWNPDTELAAVVTHLLPGLLIYQNAKDAYNVEAGALLDSNKSDYEKMVEDYSFQHGKPA